MATDPLYLYDPVFERERKYLELMRAVTTNHPNETTHETALRYIQEAETRLENRRYGGEE